MAIFGFHASPKANDIIQLPFSFEKAKFWVITQGDYTVRIEGVPELSVAKNSYVQEIEVPRLGGHSPNTVKITAVNPTSVNAVYWLIERTGGAPDENYWKIESVDPDGTIHYAEEST